MELEQLNKLQMPTWRWLHMNAAKLTVDADIDTAYTNPVEIHAPSGVCIGQDKPEAFSADAGAGSVPEAEALPEDVGRVENFIRAHQNYHLTVKIPDGVRLEEPVVLDFLLDETSPVLIDYLDIEAGANSRADILVSYRQTGAGAAFHGGFAGVTAGEGADIRLIKSQQLAGASVHLDMNAGVAGPGAHAGFLLCELGAKESVSGANLLLTGTESFGRIEGIYLGDKDRRQDFNYRIDLRGKKTQGDVDFKGALAGEAKKVMKMTLDFVKGASGARGKEEENVLALSDKTMNLTAPLLLCGEENVAGEHATSTGRPDPDKLYYLMSRGFSEQEAKRLMIEASFTPIIDKIPLGALRADIKARIKEVVYDEA